jgi:hypothetical protein
MSTKESDGYYVDGLTSTELDHVFMALLLHTKTTRAEQAAWVTIRANIWKKLIPLSAVDDDAEQVIHRTMLFNSPEALHKFWKDPNEIHKVLSFPANPAKKAKAAP